MRSFHVCVVAFIVWCPLQLSQAAEPVKRSEAGQRIWDLTTYIKGTPQQIHDNLCKEMHEFQAKIKAAEDKIEGDKRDVEADRSNAVAKVLNSDEYRRAKADSSKWKEVVDAAHKAHDTGAAMDASKRFNDARQAAERIEAAAKKAGDQDRLVLRDQKLLAEDQERLAALKKGLADATQWHDSLVEAIGNTFLLKWPVTSHDTGNLGEVVPRTVTPAGDLICNYNLAEEVDKKGTSEGVQRVMVSMHRVEVVILGAKLNQKEIPFNHNMRFDHCVEVKTCKPSSDVDYEVRLEVEVKQDDLEELLQAVARP